MRSRSEKEKSEDTRTISLEKGLIGVDGETPMTQPADFGMVELCTKCSKAYRELKGPEVTVRDILQEALLMEPVQVDPRQPPRPLQPDEKRKRFNMLMKIQAAGEKIALSGPEMKMLGDAMGEYRGNSKLPTTLVYGRMMQVIDPTALSTSEK